MLRLKTVTKWIRELKPDWDWTVDWMQQNVALCTGTKKVNEQELKVELQVTCEPQIDHGGAYPPAYIVQMNTIRVRGESLKECGKKLFASMTQLREQSVQRQLSEQAFEVNMSSTPKSVREQVRAYRNGNIFGHLLCDEYGAPIVTFDAAIRRATDLFGDAWYSLECNGEIMYRSQTLTNGEARNLRAVYGTFGGCVPQYDLTTTRQYDWLGTYNQDERHTDLWLDKEEARIVVVTANETAEYIYINQIDIAAVALRRARELGLWNLCHG